MHYTRKRADEAVQRGMELLDERLPGWIERIDLGELSLRNCYQCVLGQNYGDYFDAVEILWPELRSTSQYRAAEAHGFFLPECVRNRDVGWRTLTAAWCDAIEARLND